MTGTGSGLGDAFRKGVGLVHGSGEAIRGNVNAAVDSAAGDRESAAKNQAIASRGIDEAEHGHYHGTGAGVTPVDTTVERQNRTAQGEFISHTHAAPGVGSTNHGPHTTNTGNKLDPRFDSDLDHRGAQTDRAAETFKKPRRTNTGEHFESRFDVELNDRDYHESSTSHWPRRSNTDKRVNSNHVSYGHPTSSNHGPYSTNIANKFDPQVDSDLDNRGLATGLLYHGPHSTDIADRLDPRYASGQDHHDTHTGHGSAKYGTHSTIPANKLDPRYNSEQDHHSSSTGHGPTNYGPHSTNIANKFDPRFDSGQDYGSAEIYNADYPAPKLVYKSSTVNNFAPHVNSEFGYFQGAAPSRQTPRLERHESEPMPYFTSAYEDIQFRPPGPLTPRPYRSSKEEAEKRLQCEDGRWLSNRDTQYERQQQGHAQHSTRIANILDPRTKAMGPKGEPNWTENPHKSNS